MHKIVKKVRLAETTQSHVVFRAFFRHPLVCVALFIFTASAYPLIFRENSEWHEVYIRAANHLRAGEGIYRLGDGYVYPPLMALVAAPFSLLPKYASVAAWYSVNIVAIFVLCHFAWRIAQYVRTESSDAGRAHADHWIWLLGLACGIRYAFDGLSHQQTDIVIGAFLMGGCWLLVHRRTLWGATALGLAAGAKCTPLLFAVYLVWRRQWRPAVWLVAAALLVNLAPNWLYAQASGESYLVQWARTYLMPDALSPHYAHSEQLYNQSIRGAINRWSTTTLQWTTGGVAVLQTAPIIDAGARSAVAYSVMGLLLFGFGWRSLRSGRSQGFEVWQMSGVLLLMVLLSPMSSKPHFCTLILPGLCLARHAIENRNRVAFAFLIGAIVIGGIGIRGLVGKEMATWALWCGNVTWSSLFLLAGCVYGMGNTSDQPRKSTMRLRYPLITPMGRKRATLRESPARSTTSTTSSTSL